MDWIKRNIGLVGSLAVGLVLLGVAGWFLSMKKETADGATTQLDEATQKLKTLYNRDPRPNQENIKAGKEDAQKVEAFVASLEPHFIPPQLPKDITGRSFGLLMDEMLNSLRQTAKRYSVKLPQDYKFGFASQATNVNIPAESLSSLVLYLHDVDALGRAVFSAKVNSIEGIKRPSVPSDETLGSLDFLTEKPVTNEWTIATPYEISFKGFSPNIAEVLAALQKLKSFVAVKNMSVGPASADQADGTPGGASGLGMRMDSMPAGPSSSDMARYGLGGGGGGSRYGRAPRAFAPVVPVAPVAPRTHGPIVDEQLLQVILSLDIVRPVPAQKNQPAPVASGTDSATPQP